MLDHGSRTGSPGDRSGCCHKGFYERAVPRPCCCNLRGLPPGRRAAESGDWSAVGLIRGRHRIHSSYSAWQLRGTFLLAASRRSLYIDPRAGHPGRWATSRKWWSIWRCPDGGPGDSILPVMRVQLPLAHSLPFPLFPIPAAGAKPRLQHERQVLWQAHPQAQGETGGSIPPLLSRPAELRKRCAACAE